MKLKEKGQDFSGKIIVCVVTGMGLKDADIATKSDVKMLEVEGELAAVENALDLK